jgi:hypothetical protein
MVRIVAEGGKPSWSQAREARRKAYEAETDPLFGKVLRGEISADYFKARCEEIRARYPYPEE